MQNVDATDIKDIVLIHFEDEPTLFARVEDISADARPDWYHVELLMLQVPVRNVTWILREAYINGAEFTMDGHRIRFEKVVSPKPAPAAPEEGPPKGRSSKDEGKVISLSDLKKR